MGTDDPKSNHTPSPLTLIKMAARTLSKPYKTGTLISIPDLMDIARRNNIPIPLRGTREEIIEELLKVAYDYGVLENVCKDIIELVDKRYRKLSVLVKGLPEAYELYNWVEKGVKNTRRILGLILESLEESKKTRTENNS